MKAHRRILSAIVLFAAISVPALAADDKSKPVVRAITGFITIDAKSYTLQIEEAVKFLSQVRDTVKAAGYDVSGIRISTQPFPEFTLVAKTGPDAVISFRSHLSTESKLQVQQD